MSLQDIRTVFEGFSPLAQYIHGFTQNWLGCPSRDVNEASKKTRDVKRPRRLDEAKPSRPRPGRTLEAEAKARTLDRGRGCNIIYIVFYLKKNHNTININI